jgi:cytochrome P450
MTKANRSSRDAPVFAVGGALGNARAFRKDPLALATLGHAEHRDVVRLPLVAGFGVYGVAHPDGAKRVLADNNKNYIKGRAYDWLRNSVGRGLLTTDEDEHKWRRSLLMPTFSRRTIDSVLPMIVECVEQQAALWDSRADSITDVHADMTDLTLRIIGRLLFGEDFGTANNDLRSSLTSGSRLVRKLMGSPSQFLPGWVPTRVNRAIAANRAVLDSSLRTILLTDGHGDRTANLAERLRADMREPHSDGSTYRDERDLFDELVLLVAAGHETTANTLTWTWHLVSQNPGVDARMRDEVDRVLQGESIAPHHLPALDYTRRIVLESNRLMPPAWGILRQAISEDVVCGVRIPSGALVLISPYVIQRDERWWPDKLRFDPDRHLPGARDEAPKYSYVPFGAGPRACIGRLLAETETVVTLAHLASRFTLEAGPEPVRSVTLATLQPADGLRMRVQRRVLSGA